MSGLKVIDGTPTAISKYLRDKQVCNCGHLIDDHVPDMECSLCDCPYYLEDKENIQTKCKGETYEESNKRNNYFFEEGRMDVLEKVKQIINKLPINLRHAYMTNKTEYLIDKKELTKKLEEIK